MFLNICQSVAPTPSHFNQNSDSLDTLLIPFSTPRERECTLRVSNPRFPLTTKAVCTSSPSMNIWSGVSAWHDIFHLQDYASFSCVTSPQFAKYHVSRANNRATKGDNMRGARYFVEKAVKLMSVFFFSSRRGGSIAGGRGFRKGT